MTDAEMDAARRLSRQIANATTSLFAEVRACSDLHTLAAIAARVDELISLAREGAALIPSASRLFEVVGDDVTGLRDHIATCMMQVARREFIDHHHQLH